MSETTRWPIFVIAGVLMAYSLKDIMTQFSNEDDAAAHQTVKRTRTELMYKHSADFELIMTSYYSGHTSEEVKLSGYRRVFEQYYEILRDRYPMMEFEGDNFPPPQHRIVFSQFLSIAKMLVIVLLVMGINPFDYFNMATPNIWHWLMGNKLYGALMVMFLTNAIENHLMSTGAFEVWLNGIPVWSKLESGRVPNPPEMFQIIDNALQMKMSPEDSLRSHFADGSATVMS